MGSKIVGLDIGKQVCEALGLDPKRTRSIDLSIHPNKLVTATVEHFIDGDQANALVNVLSAYTLRHEKDVKQEPVADGADITPLGEGDRLMRFFKGGE